MKLLAFSSVRRCFGRIYPEVEHTCRRTSLTILGPEVSLKQALQAQLVHQALNSSKHPQNTLLIVYCKPDCHHCVPTFHLFLTPAAVRNAYVSARTDVPRTSLHSCPLGVLCITSTSCFHNRSASCGRDYGSSS